MLSSFFHNGVKTLDSHFRQSFSKRWSGTREQLQYPINNDARPSIEMVTTSTSLL